MDYLPFTMPIPMLLSPFQCLCHSISLHPAPISPLISSRLNQARQCLASHPHSHKIASLLHSPPRIFSVSQYLIYLRKQVCIHHSTMVVSHSNSINKKLLAKGTPGRTSSKSNILKNTMEQKKSSPPCPPAHSNSLAGNTPPSSNASMEVDQPLDLSSISLSSTDPASLSPSKAGVASAVTDASTTVTAAADSLATLSLTSVAGLIPHSPLSSQGFSVG